MLKPDSKRSEIVSCALSDGTETISFPWSQAVSHRIGKLISSGIPLIASNAKFEERWFQHEYGYGAKNWYWDTMQTAHTLDNRATITGIEFQAFVLLGQEPWDAGISEFFKAKSANEPNRIREIPLPRLLKYGGMDAVIEWQVADIQKLAIGERRLLKNFT